MPIPRKIAIVCLNHWADEPRTETFAPFSAGAWRVYAALVEPPLADCQVRLFDFDGADAAAISAELIAFEPDLVGGSAYVWSLPLLLVVAADLKRTRPATAIVLGGPSARPAMLDHPHFAPWRWAIDALVVSEGETPTRALAQADGIDAWGFIAGVVVRHGDGWRSPAVAELPALDSLPSPYQLGIAPRGRSGSLETFRGCPLACSFCEWGVWSQANRVFSVQYLAAELQAYLDLGAIGAFVVDAGLNLNRRALHNLIQAEEQVGFFARHPLAAEIYCAQLRDEDFAFLERIRCGRLGVGLQSADPQVLRSLQRPHDQQKFETNLRRLSDIADADVELIVGLPGDTFEGFKRSLHYAVALPCVRVHVYHCLVLPDGLMTRAAAGADCDFDPVTLRMRSCATWPANELAKAVQWLTDCALSVGGDVSVDYWSFPAAFPPRHQAIRPPSNRQYTLPLFSDKFVALSTLVAGLTHGRWSLSAAAQTAESAVLTTLTAPCAEIVLEFCAATACGKAWRTLSGVQVSHRGQPDAAILAQLEAILPELVQGLQAAGYLAVAARGRDTPNEIRAPAQLTR